MINLYYFISVSVDLHKCLSALKNNRKHKISVDLVLVSKSSLSTQINLWVKYEQYS